MSRSLGIPVKLLHESTGHVVTVEMKSGELYRGSMLECEDNWNCQLENITYTAKVRISLSRFSINAFFAAS
nr:small nuclear ribonucleoprotein SmD3b-like [Ipomoea batatas]GMD51472.1 small nuclear ribonucleoprotein SmD3b-like [Ipomoea batatas]GMD56468.1 small nuclear ribonucleoprotein SmD3b-like [Ipomoea batatas]